VLDRRDKILYVAGLIDGEAWIGVRVHNKSRTYTPAISINMTEEAPLELLKELFGGMIKFSERTKYNKNAKPIYTWEIGGNTCLPILREIRPYLLIKGSRIDVISKSKWEPYGRKNNIPDDERALRKSIYEELRVR
jgi:hypothetical protein